MKVCTFSGNIGRDAETRYTPNNKAITTFPLAVSVGWGDNKKTMWVRCNCWGERYGKLAQYLTKGGKVLVSGEMSENEYESQGEPKKSLELNVRELDLPPKGQAGTQSQHQQAKANGHQPQSQDFDDDISF